MTPEQLEEIEARAKTAARMARHFEEQIGNIAADHVAEVETDTLALTAALRQAWEENGRLREALDSIAFGETVERRNGSVFRCAMSGRSMQAKARAALKEPTHDQD